MPGKNRRLFNINVDEVSLVDIAANQKQFVVVKQQTEENMDEVLKVLKAVEDALNKLPDAISDEVKKQLEKANEPTIEKAGAKFSKATVAQLKGVYLALGKLLGDQKDEDADVEKTDDNTSFAKGLKLGLGGEEAKDVSKDSEKLISSIIAKTLEAVKNVNEKEEG